MANPKPAGRAPARSIQEKKTNELVIHSRAGRLRISLFAAKGEEALVPPLKPSMVGKVLRRYGEAVAQSQAVGRRVSFRVDVGPDGRSTVTEVEEARASEPFPVEEVRDRDPALEEALAAARERGRVRAAEVLAGDDMLSADALAGRLGTSRMTVNSKRQNGRLLGLEGARRGFRFPAWQLDANGKPYAELPALHERLGGPWAVYRFLVQAHGSLDGLTGRQALERGRGKAVVAAAEGVARGDFA